MENRYPSRLRNHALEIAEDLSNDDENEEDEDDDEDDESEDEDDEEGDDYEDDDPQLPYPGFVPIALRYFDQTTQPRKFCLRMITNPYPFHTMYLF